MDPQPAPEPKSLFEAARDFVTAINSGVVVFIDSEGDAKRPLTDLQAFKELEQASKLPE